MDDLIPNVILWIDQVSGTDEIKSIDQQSVIVAFADGSCLQIFASVKRPPLGEMEPTSIEYIDPDTWDLGMIG